MSSHFGTVLSGEPQPRQQSRVGSHFGTTCGSGEWSFGLKEKYGLRRGSFASHFGGSVGRTCNEAGRTVPKEPDRPRSMTSHFGMVCAGVEV